ncbi:unnamed protein product [Blepharisma stoltei]|uniref:Uncharacterized protein n=1 Tax=Blepharisma stoltei TaxID=1481888 RepID=A0AAU9I7E9_9CILI|nr:unnamed protein product [Blepharisma stoltei]
MSFVSYPQLNSNRLLLSPWTGFSKRPWTSQKLRRTFGQSPLRNSTTSPISQRSYLNISQLNISSKFENPPSPISLAKKTTIFLNIPTLKLESENTKPSNRLQRNTYLRYSTPDSKIEKNSAIVIKPSVKLTTQKVKIHTSLMDYARNNKTPKPKEVKSSISVDGKRISLN